jgi:hypothetical protein
MAESTTVKTTTMTDDEKNLWEQVRLAVLQRIQASTAQSTPQELRELMELYRDFYRVH